jgi:hypothetical protein
MSYKPSNPNGQATSANSEPVVIASDQSAIPVTGPLTDTQLRNTAVPVSLASVPSHAVTLASTTITGTVAVTDNAGSITVDAPVGTPAFVRLSDGAAAITTLPVSLASVPSHAVTNAGTFAVQVTSAPTTAVTGTFWQATQPVSLASVPSHAVTNAGTFAVQAAQSGTWTVQPGNTANTTPWLVKTNESLGTATALGALNAEITQALNGNLGGAATVTATSTPTGIVLTPYASYDGGTNWTVTQFFNSAIGDVVDTLTSFTIGAAYSISAGDGATHVKVRATSWTSGSVTIRISSTNSQGLVNLKATAYHDSPVGNFVLQAGAYASSTAPTAVVNGDAVRLWATTAGALNIADGGGSITVDGTVAATQSGTWNIGSITTLPTLANVTTVGTVSAITAGPAIGSGFYVRNTDGTNTAAVKAASTAAAATDPALVVAISPNNTIHVSLASVPSHAVTNAGTFAVQAAQSGTWNIGSITTLPALAAGTNAIGKLAANAGVIVGAVELAPATTNAPTNATTTAYATSLIVKASAGTLYTITGYNSKTSAQFIQIHDSATLPADAAVPKVIFVVPASSNFSFDLSPFGRSFAAGITICNSSTGPTKTIGAADCWFDAQYK